MPRGLNTPPLGAERTSQAMPRSLLRGIWLLLKGIFICQMGCWFTEKGGTMLADYVVRGYF